MSEAKHVPKGTLLQTWRPFAVIPFWKSGGGRTTHDDDDDAAFASVLPGYPSCPILSLSWTLSIDEYTDSAADMKRFIDKLYEEDSFEALAMLTTIHIVQRNFDAMKIAELAPPSDQDYDDSLLVEGWPLIQKRISWDAFSLLFRCIYSRLHMVTLPHPLAAFAQDRLLHLPSEDFEKAIQGALRMKWIDTATENRLRASQLFLDYVASLPPRRVGVLLDDQFHNNSEMPTRLSQSCLPSATLELSVVSNEIQCFLISLYDSSEESSMTVSTRPPKRCCTCASCQYNRNPAKFRKTIQTRQGLEQAQQLAHHLFQQERYDEAMGLYQLCHEAIPPKERSAKADLWHAMGAVQLTRHEFVKAQSHWRDGKEYADIHPGIALQVEKQRAYRYFDLLIQMEEQGCDDFDFETLSPRRLFVTPNFVPTETCQQLIQWAEEIGSNTGGWTTGRHYAVPTHDVPIHGAPKLLEWFQEWMNQGVQGLLRAQFQTTRRFYVHDAFLVRYSASAKSRFLPLHYDESTHSMVLALNDDFQGGGTYFYDQDRTISACPTGALVSFRGNQLLHGGNVVTKGVRYILAVFLYLDNDICGATLADPPSKRQKVLPGGVGGGFSFDFF